MSRSQYLYATGRIRSLENKLLAPSDLERMIDAKDAQMAFKVFNDLSYADELSDIESVKDYIEVLDHDLLQIRDLLRQITPDEEIIRILFLRYDFHNIKLMFKAKYADLDLSDYESQLGNEDVVKLKDFILKDAMSATAEEITGLIKEAKKKFDKELPDGYTIDSYFDRESLLMLQKTAADLKYEFLSELVKTWIDVANVKMFLRAKKLDLPIEKVEDYLVEGGSILKSSLANSYSKDLKEAVTICIRGFENTSLKEAIKNFAEGDELWKFEKAFENYEIKFIQQSKYIAYGPEPLVSYYLAKKNAIRNIRLVFTGKLNGLDNNEIKERMRDIY